MQPTEAAYLCALWMHKFKSAQNLGTVRTLGAAAVAPALRTQELAYLGKETTTTVYAGELLGILMGLGIILTSNPCKAAMFTDNQAALKALQNPQRSSGQSILRRIMDAPEEAKVRGINVEFHWIPAHQGIEATNWPIGLQKRQPVAGSC
jgi:ribonuclease HI